MHGEGARDPHQPVFLGGVLSIQVRTKLALKGRRYLVSLRAQTLNGGVFRPVHRRPTTTTITTMQ